MLNKIFLELCSAIKFQKPIIIIKEIYFKFSEIPPHWKEFSDLLTGPRTIPYSAYFVTEAAERIKQVRSDPDNLNWYYKPTGSFFLLFFLIIIKDIFYPSPFKFMHKIDRKFTSFHPQEVAMYQSRVAAVDPVNNCVHVFFPSKNNDFGGNGTEPGKFSHPTSICASPDGRLYIADTDNNRIQIFSEKDKFEAVVGSKGTGNGQFNNPIQIRVRNERFYVIDRWTNRVQAFTLEGKFDKCITNDAIKNPRALEVSSSFIYIKSKEYDYIQVFTLNGEYFTKITTPLNMEFMGMSWENYLYVTYVVNTNKNEMVICKYSETFERMWSSALYCKADKSLLVYKDTLMVPQYEGFVHVYRLY